MKIAVEGIQVKGYHGVYPIELKKGNQFVIDVLMEVDDPKVEMSDALEDTVDYFLVYRIVLEQMKTRQNLIERVAHNIAQAVLQSHPGIKEVSVRVGKLKPHSMNKSRSAWVEISCTREG